jgi:hypothetical protein
MPIGPSGVDQRFVTHGGFVVMPLCFPSVTEQIAPDESLVTALAVHSDGLRVIGGTSGKSAHLFEAAPKPVGGYVCDLAKVEGATETVSVLALEDRAVACVNAPAGGKVIVQWVPGRLEGIQEWSRPRNEAEALTDLPGERITDGRLGPEGRWLLLLTDRRVLRVSLEGVPTRRVWGEQPERIEPREAEGLDGGEVSEPCVGRFGITVGGEVHVAPRGGALYRVDVAGRRVEESAARLPFSKSGWGWAALPDGRLASADEDGRLFAVDPRAAQVEELGRTCVAPVKCLACLPDGRAYGLSGDGIGRFFVLDMHQKTVTDLGAVAGVLGAKRYAHTFSCAMAGPEGEIYFGEDDRGGHLWIYFPPVSRSTR